MSKLICIHIVVLHRKLTGRIHKEGKIFSWINFRSSIPLCAGNIPDTCEMLEISRLILLITHQDHSVIRNSDFLARIQSNIQLRKLCDQCFGARVFQLKCKFIGSIARIGYRCWSEPSACVSNSAVI